MTAKGIPLIWQGQELGENYFIPHHGTGRGMLLRPVRWDYFYDPIGRAMIGLMRKLLALRRSASEFRQGEHYFHNHRDHYQSKGVMLFHRRPTVQSRIGSIFRMQKAAFSTYEIVHQYVFPPTLSKTHNAYVVTS